MLIHYLSRSILTVLGGEVVCSDGPFAAADLRENPPISPDWSPPRYYETF